MTAKSDLIKALMDDQHIQGAFENVRSAYTSAILNPQTEDDDVWELRRMLFILGKVEQDLRQAIEDGEFEDLRAVEKGRSVLGDLWKSKH